MEGNGTQSKYFLFVICLVFVFVIGFSYYHFFIQNDYEVSKQVACDPATESCFVSDCESNDSTCDSETTYKKIYVVSKYAGNDYEALDCTATSTNCRIVTCQDSTVDAGEKCFK